MMDFLARAAPPEVILTSRHDWVRYRPFLQARLDGMQRGGRGNRCRVDSD